MEFQVNTNNVILSQIDQVESGEYNVTECIFTFSSEFDGLTKKAVFTGEDGIAYLQTIVDNKCPIPSEILEVSQVVEIGVYAYDVENEELVLRYSPEPTQFYIHQGSYKEAQNSTPPTPSEIEQLQAQITENANDIDGIIGDIVDINSDIADIKAEQITQNNNIQTNANNISTINEQISDINETITNLETNKANVTDLNALTERVSTNERDIDTIDGHISDINQNIDDLEQDLTNYSLITETGSQINLNVNSTNYQITAILKDKNGNVIYTSNAIDLPIESMIVNASYDNTTKEIVLTLQNGTTLRFSVADLVSGLVSTDQLTQILSNYYNKNEVDALIPDLTDYVKNTDYATYNKGGVIKSGNGFGVYSTGFPYGSVLSKNDYDNQPNYFFISKGTLENVITGKELINQTQLEESQATQDTEIEALQAENAELKQDITNMAKAMYKVDGQGSDITLQNTSENKFVEFGLNGRTEQEQLTGKNLFDNSVINNLWVAINGTIITDNSSSCLKYNCSSGEAYTISASFGATGASNIIVIAFYDENDVMLSRSVEVGSSNKEITLTKTAPENTAYMYTGHYTGIPTKIQLEKSSTPTSYEPYCGGIPAPNPIYKIPIKNVTGNANEKIQNKNLFDGQIELGSINPANGELQPSTARTRSKNFIKVKPNTTYTISIQTGQYRWIIGYTADKIGITDGNFSGQASALSSFAVSIYSTTNTFTTTATTEYIKWYDTSSTDLSEKVQIEEGSTATSYVPHQEQNYPFSFEEGQFLADDGKLQENGIYNEFQKIIFDGTENVLPYEVGDDYDGFAIKIKNTYLTNAGDRTSQKYNYFIELGHSPAYGRQPNKATMGTDGYLYVFFEKNVMANTTAVQTWLANNYANNKPLIAIGKVQNPTPIPYNSTQQAQYEAIKNARSYADKTIITSTSDELGFDMNVEAIADANKVIDNQNNEIDTIKSRLDLLEG